MITFRPACDYDASAITRIDSEGLATGHASFRNIAYDWCSFENAFVTGRGLALIALENNDIAGWAGVSPTSAREVYRGVGEVSIYVSASKQGQSIGRKLLSELIFRAEERGYWT